MPKKQVHIAVPSLEDVIFYSACKTTDITEQSLRDDGFDLGKLSLKHFLFCGRRWHKEDHEIRIYYSGEGGSKEGLGFDGISPSEFKKELEATIELYVTHKDFDFKPPYFAITYTEVYDQVKKGFEKYNIQVIKVKRMKT